MPYECNNTAGCTAYDPHGGIRDDDDWWMLRAVGDIVSDYTEVTAFEYTNYMYVIEGDVVYIEDKIFEC